MKFRRKPKRYKLLIILLAIFMGLIALHIFINERLRPALANIAEVRVKALVSDAMYSTVLDWLKKTEETYKFLKIRESENQVYHVELDNIMLTKFSAECAQIAFERLALCGKQGVDVPIGTASGVTSFAGKGPNIHMSFYPEMNTQAYYSSEFRAVGINQSIYRVLLRLEAQVAIILPGEERILKAYVEVPIAEQIIVGKVPSSYADIELELDGGGMLNLLPAQ